MNPIKLDAGVQVTLVLKAEHVQVLLMALGELPLKLSKPVDVEIERQLREAFASPDALANAVGKLSCPQQ